MTRKELEQLVKTDPRYTVAALLRLYGYQTLDEQASNTTSHVNGVGFNGADAPILSDMVRFYNQRGYLTDPHLAFIKRTICKYLGQLEGQELSPAHLREVQKPVTKTGGTSAPQKPHNNNKQVTLSNNNFIISFSYDPVVLSNIKTLTNRTCSGPPEWKWTAPICIDSYLKLRDWGFEFHVSGEGSKKALQQLIEKATGAITEVKIDKIPGIKRPLLQYQHEGVEWIDATDGRTIIGDQQGLGKTATGLAWLQYRSEIRPAVVVCPGSAKWGYYSETGYVMSTNDNAFVISGEYRKGANVPPADIYLINYDILYITVTCPTCDGEKKVLDKDGIKIKCKQCTGKGKIVKVRPDLVAALKKQGGPKAVLIDELQYLQEPDSFRTQAVVQLCRGGEDWEEVPHIIPSSGTPIKHRPKNFFPTLNLVRPDLFPSFWKYAQRYCGAVHNGYGWDFTGASNTKELHDILIAHKVLLRRTKEEVLPQLPKMRRAPVAIELSERDTREYKKAENNFLEWLASKGDTEKFSKARKAEVLARITALKNLVCKFKMKQSIEWIEEFLEGDSPLIVFAHHKIVVDELYKYFKDIAVRVDGGTTPEQKRDAETAFQACKRCGIKKDKHDIEPGACEKYIPGPKRLFIGTLAAKEALTLTAAEDTVFVELWDSPKDHEQAEERCYGRVSDPHGATAWYLLGKDTIDEKILKDHDYKRANIDAIIDGKEAQQEDSMTHLLATLLETLKED